MTQTIARNQLLAALPPDVRDAVIARCAPIRLEAGSVLVDIDRESEAVLFVESGLVSVVAGGGNLAEVEIGMIGREGMLGAWLAMGREAAPFRMMGQLAGSALRMASGDFRAACDGHPALRQEVHAYLDRFTGMLAETCQACARLTIEGRVARWLLVASERSGSDHIPITHDAMSRMLAVRRPGVTVALHILEGERAIRARRGFVRIVDRQKLEAVARGARRLPHDPRQPLPGSRRSDPPTAVALVQ